MCTEKLFIGERPIIQLTADGEHVSLHAPGSGAREIVLPVALFRMGLALALDVAREHDQLQAQRGIRAELAIVPLCDLCTRHGLPRDAHG